MQSQRVNLTPLFTVMTSPVLVISMSLPFRQSTTPFLGSQVLVISTSAVR